MTKLESIQNLRLRLEKIQGQMVKLDQDIRNLREVVEAEAFVPEGMNAQVREDLIQLKESQNTFFEQYGALEIGDPPQNVRTAAENLKNEKIAIENRQQIASIRDQFMKLESEDVVVRVALRDQQEMLSSIKPDEVDPQIMVPYAALLTYIKSKGKDTTSLFKVAKLGETIFVAATRMKIHIPKESVKEEPWKQETLDGAPSDEPEKQERKNLGIWEDLGIMEPEAMIVSQDPESFKMEAAAKVNMRFGVKEFKGFMEKYPKAEKLGCLYQLAAVSCYDEYALERAARFGSSQEQGKAERFEQATEQLFRAGYLKRYTIDGEGSFYGLSGRGMRIFSTRDSFMYVNYSGAFNGLKARRLDAAEENYAAALSRILYLHCDRKIDLTAPKAGLTSENQVRGSAFLRHFTEDADIYFTGIVSEEPEDFKTLKVMLKEKVPEKSGQLITVGVTLDQARSLASWIGQHVLPDKKNIAYCTLDDDQIYDLNP